MLKIIRHQQAGLPAPDVRVHFGVATLAAIGLALCRGPVSRTIRLVSSSPAHRWTQPEAAPSIESKTDAGPASSSKTTYRVPRQPIVALLVLARRLRDLTRSRTGGLYGP